MTVRTSLHGFWSSRLTFVLAVTGSAVGLGNIWKFPYITGQNGGGAFVMVYLLCVFLIGLPTMMAEVLIGRRGRRNPVQTMRLLGEEETGHKAWQLVGIGGVLGALLILSFYSVVAGWALAYVTKSATGTFGGATPEQVGTIFNSMTASAGTLFFWHTAFMALTILVVARGVQRGLEAAIRVLMPALLLLLLVLLVYSIMNGNFQQALNYMFRPDFSEIEVRSVLIALGHAFFTLSVGMGAVMAYGAYLPENTSIAGTSVAVVLADTGIALLAGLVIFPIVFANNLDTASGPGLIFQTLPLAFGQMPGGAIFGTMFFVLLSFAAWTSSIGLLEPAVAWMVETRNFVRSRAAIVVGVAVWLFGLLTVFSFNWLADFKIGGRTIYGNIDHLATNILLPLGGLSIVVFAGWAMCRNSTAEELDIGTGLRYQAWRVATRFVAPAAIVCIFLYSLGLFDKLLGK